MIKYSGAAPWANISRRQYMIKSELGEIKKLYTPKNCSVTRIAGCYVDAEKNKAILSEYIYEKTAQEINAEEAEKEAK